jgi:prephenate dehydrogenase
LSYSRIAVLGTGLMGGSFALAARRAAPQAVIAGWDREAGARERALQRGAIHESHAALADALRGAELVYVALPLAAAFELLAEIARLCEPHALVTDACGTKAALVRAAAIHFRGAAKFLGGHPMAGRERKGVEHAEAELLRDAAYVLIGSAEAAGERERRFAAFVESTGARPVWMDAETHDWAVAVVSHLPQMAAVALAQVVSDETDETGLPLALAGPGLRDSLRLAGSPYGNWRDICLTNTPNIARALDRLAQAVDALRRSLTTRELEAHFAASNELYRRLREMK